MAMSRPPRQLKDKIVYQSNAFSEAIFLSIGDGVIVTDEWGNIAKINQAALEMLGYEESEILQRWYPSVISAVDEKGHKIRGIDRPIIKAFLTGGPVSERSYYVRKDGTILPVLVTISPILYAGRPVGTVQVIKDYTAEHEIDQTKTDFISIASHQLRTPATGVRQYLAMLLEGYAGELSEEQQFLLNKAYESNERQLQIVEDLLKVAHIDSGQVNLLLEETDLSSLLKDILAEQQTKFDAKKQTTSFAHPDAPVWFDVDRARLRMALENIIDNAWKYTPNGRNIAIELKSTPRRVIITVEDEGIGIKPQDTKKLFQKFSRLNSEMAHSVSGTGLGLYWANKIILMHGGIIRVRSIYKKGSRFSIILPRTIRTPIHL